MVAVEAAGADSAVTARGALAVGAGMRVAAAELAGAGIEFPGAAIAAPGPCSSDAPHMPQKRCVSGFSLPQCGQRKTPPSLSFFPLSIDYDIWPIACSEN
jgi:hypothetical protein